jgi:hypothetical protein
MGALWRGRCSSCYESPTTSQSTRAHRRLHEKSAPALKAGAEGGVEMDDEENAMKNIGSLPESQDFWRDVPRPEPIIQALRELGDERMRDKAKSKLRGVLQVYKDMPSRRHVVRLIQHALKRFT